MVTGIFEYSVTERQNERPPVPSDDSIYIWVGYKSSIMRNQLSSGVSYPCPKVPNYGVEGVGRPVSYTLIGSTNVVPKSLKGYLNLGSTYVDIG